MNIRRSARRAICALVGCVVDVHPCCDRCGVDLYEGFIENGKLDPLFRRYWRLRRLIRKLGPKKCQQCGKKYRRGYDEYLCSEECHDNWLPF